MKRLDISKSFGLVVCGLVGVLLPAGSSAFGQMPEKKDRQYSHGDIPGGGLGDRTQLIERLNQARWSAEFSDLSRKSRTDVLTELQKDPKRKQEIEDLLRSLLKNHQFDRDDPLAKQLEGIVRDWGGKDGRPPPGFDQGLWKEIEQTAKKRKEAAKPSNPAGPPPSGASQPSSQPPRNDAASNGANPFAMPHRNTFDERLMQWAQRFIEGNPRLRDSDIMRSVVEELDRLRFREALQDHATDGLGMKLAQGVEKLLPSQQFLDSHLRPILSRLPRPNLPDIHLPSIDLPRLTLPAVGLPAPNLAAPSGGQLGVGLLVILGVAALVFFGTRIHRHGIRHSLRVFGESGSNGNTVRLDLRTPITTRQDLVRAFEQLSVQELGLDAQNWNHRTIAEQLGGYHVKRRRAASNLAKLYEAARYTPEDHILPADALRTAQREIEFLAGVPST